jgi:chromosome segregation ATPase
LACKKLDKTAAERATGDEISPSVNQLKVVEQDLETEKEKIRTLKKKIDALKERRKILTDGLNAREEMIDDRDGVIVAARDRIKVLERKVERKELAIGIITDVIKLSNLPFEEER